MIWYEFKRQKHNKRRSCGKIIIIISTQFSECYPKLSKASKKFASTKNLKPIFQYIAFYKQTQLKFSLNCTTLQTEHKLLNNNSLNPETKLTKYCFEISDNHVQSYHIPVAYCESFHWKYFQFCFS